MVKEAHADPLVIEAVIEGYKVSRVLVDTGSSINMICKSAFDQLEVHPSRVQSVSAPIAGIGGFAGNSLGDVKLDVQLGREDGPVFRADLEFVVSDLKTGYNVILGRPFLCGYATTISPLYMVL